MLKILVGGKVTINHTHTYKYAVARAGLVTTKISICVVEYAGPPALICSLSTRNYIRMYTYTHIYIHVLSRVRVYV